MRAVTAGDYDVKVEPFSRIGTNGPGDTLPQYITKPSTFTVSVQ